MDFVVHWLDAMGEADRKPVMDHPRFEDLLDESVALAAPGDVANVAQMGDVEAKQMPYHLSAHAKLWSLNQDARSAWLVSRCRADWMRADSLGALINRVDQWVVKQPDAGALDAHYATVLRSGWCRNDMAVVVSASNSPMSHLQKDSGTLLIGSRGRWLIDDPGYQQYIKKTEREFTLGATAHNTPVINGQGHVSKLTERNVALDKLGNDFFRMAVDLTSCYPQDLSLDQVKRTVWLKGRDLVVVADQVQGSKVDLVNYYWHGHPDAAWWVADNWAQIYFPDAILWMSSPQSVLSDANVDRLPGSRGQLTLCVEAEVNVPVNWWVFSLGSQAPSVSVKSQGLDVNGENFGLVE